jgi:type VI secretion system protein ImpK
MSQDDDPFSKLKPQRTIVIPTPGQAPRKPAPAAAAPVAAPDPEALASLTFGTALNPLVAAASPLLSLVPQLRVGRLPDPAALRSTLVESIRRFEARARADGVRSENVLAARYILCTFLDETCASTPWGGSGVWAKQSLLVTFHSETWGGEKFFQLLAKLAETPQANRDLLELMHVCMALGFKGRYHAIDNGQAQVDALRERLFHILRQQRGEPEKEYSPHWRGAPTRRALLSVLPIWSVAAVVGVVLLLVYLALSWALNRKSDPLFTRIGNIRGPVLSVAAPPPPPKLAEKPRLSGFLLPEIQQDLVAVRDLADRSIVTIKGDGFFQPGSDRITDRVLPLLQRISEALNSVPGKVLITGHTDSRPIRSARFPSNWHLSQARAESVAKILTTSGTPGDRLRAEGRADAEPVADNETAENRARNRRVEITLFVANP